MIGPVEHTSGGARRYDEAVVARVERIKELRELMGLNLDVIGSILTNEERLRVLI